MVLAWSSAAASGFCPGTTNSVGMPRSTSMRSIASSRGVTISAETNVVPGSSLCRFSGAVASSAPTTNICRCRSRSIPASSGSESAAMARATPSAATASSVVP